MEFENNQINTENLPDFIDTYQEKPHKDYLWIMYFTRGLFSIFLGILITAGVIFIPNDEFSIFKLIAIIFLSLVILLNLLLTNIVFSRKSYSLRQKDIIYRTGYLFSSVTIIPFNRIQHIEVITGPIEKLFGLSSLKIYTAGGSQSDLTIPGLRLEKANKIKSFVISKTSLNEES